MALTRVYAMGNACSYSHGEICMIFEFDICIVIEDFQSSVS